MPATDQPVRYYRFSRSAGWSAVDARVITEAAVSLTVNGTAWLSFHCTPANLDALAVGFLYNEGLIQSRAEIAAVDVCANASNVDVWLSHAVQQPTTWRRTSGCTGGMTSVSQELPELPISPDRPPLAPETLLSGMEQLLRLQDLYRSTGGVHCSAISDGTAILAQAEDIGRHNTLDKLSGMLLFEDLRADPLIILTTGRVSAEMLQKSARLGAAAVVSRTSPTSQSVEMAGRLGIVLAGYARRGEMLVYTHPGRLNLPDGQALQPGQTPPGC